MNRLARSKTLTPHMVNGVGYYSFPAFDAYDFVRHGFSTRFGGVSEGVFESMNLSFTRGDNPERVRENFERFCQAVGVDSKRAVVSAQEHHTVIYNATGTDCGRGVYRERGYRDIDGLITDEPNVVLFTQYADCVPLFFLDPVRRVVGTSHAGWRGTVAQIAAITVERMCRDYGCCRENILAAIGPSIGPCCFEVDEPVYREFLALDLSCFVKQTEEKYWIDLWQTNYNILRSAGIAKEHITVTDLCTKCNPDVFWSHRVTGGERGSLAGCISLV